MEPLTGEEWKALVRAEQSREIRDAQSPRNEGVGVGGVAEGTTQGAY